MTPEERQINIEIIRAFPAALQAAIAGLSDEQLTAVPLPGEWSIVQNVHHCADSHMNSYVRLKLILTEDEPPLKPYDEEAWAQFRDSNSTDFTDTFHLLEGLHGRWTDTFDALTDEQWQRTGIHGAGGTMSCEDLVAGYAAHCQAHLAQIERNKAAM